MKNLQATGLILATRFAINELMYTYRTTCTKSHLWEAAPTPIPLSKAKAADSPTVTSNRQSSRTQTAPFLSPRQKRQKAEDDKMQSSLAQRLTMSDFCRQKSHRDSRRHKVTKAGSMRRRMFDCALQNPDTIHQRQLLHPKIMTSPGESTDDD